MSAWASKLSQLNFTIKKRIKKERILGRITMEVRLIILDIHELGSAAFSQLALTAGSLEVVLVV